MKRISLKESLQFGIYFLTRLFTKENTLTFLKYLPKAHRIAFKRFSSKPAKYGRIIGLYLENCANFTHFKGLTKDISKQLKHRKYKQWQLYSWKDLQKSKVKSVEIIEKPEIKPSSLSEKIRMKLDNGYEFIGTRLEALSHFVEPYLKRGMLKIKNNSRPSLEQFFDIELKAYLKAHLARPEILGKLNFVKLKKNLKNKFRSKKEYQCNMHILFKNVMRSMASKDVRSG